MRPPQKLLELEKQFVRLIVINMVDADVGQFDFDFDTTFAILVLNQNKQTYLRYGGRDDKSADSFVSLASCELALTRGLELHRAWKEGDLMLPASGSSKAAQSYPFVAHQARSVRRCIHCHDIASGQAIEVFDRPEFDLQKDIWIYPQPSALGLHLDPEDGSKLLRASGSAADAGLKSGDRLVAVNGKPANTFTDVQYHLHGLRSDSDTAHLTLADDRTVDLALPENWRQSDISWRRLGLRLSPSAGFGGIPLNAERKRELQLSIEGFATEVSFFDYPKPVGSPLQQGDIVYAVNDHTASPLTQHAALHISLTHDIGEELRLGVLRRGQNLSLNLVVGGPPSAYQRIMDSNGKAGKKKTARDGENPRKQKP